MARRAGARTVRRARHDPLPTPFLRRSVTPDLAYYRLHGISGSRHVDSDDEPRTLRTTVGDTEAYVMFNNLARGPDAARFAASLQRLPQT